MSRLLRTTAAAVLAAALVLGSGAASYAVPAKAWVKVEFNFKVSGKARTVYADIPVPPSMEASQYCARDLFYSQNGFVYGWQHGDPALANAKFVSMKCVSEGGKVKTSRKPTEGLPGPGPLPNLAGVKLYFADAGGKEVSKVYQERRDHMSSADCNKRFGSLVARYKQMASQDKRLGKMTFLRGECVVLKTFN